MNTVYLQLLQIFLLTFFYISNPSDESTVRGDILANPNDIIELIEYTPPFTINPIISGEDKLLCCNNSDNCKGFGYLLVSLSGNIILIKSLFGFIYTWGSILQPIIILYNSI